MILVKLVDKEDDSFSFIGCDTITRRPSGIQPNNSSLRDKMIDQHIAVCSSIQKYSVYYCSIGFDMNRVCCPPDSVRDVECTRANLLKGV